MPRTKRRIVALALVVFITAQSACDKNKIHEAAKASDRIATLVGAAIDLKRELAQSGEISPQEELKLTETLLTVAQRGKQFNDYARTLTADTPQTRLELADAFSKVVAAINNFSNSAVFPVKNPEAKKRLLAILNSINASVIIIDAALKG